MIKENLKNILTKILIDEPVLMVRTERRDYNAYRYFLQEFSTSSDKFQLSFFPEEVSGTLSQRDEMLYNARYNIVCNGLYIGFIQRRPVRRMVFNFKPYQPQEKYIFNLLTKIAQEIMPTTKVEII